MKKIIGLCLFISQYFGLFAQEKVNTKPYKVGEIVELKSTILNETRVLNIYLPDGYNSNEIYPVIYLLDGSAHEDFLHIVGLVQFFNLQFTMPKTIVVGIANVDRKRDFTFPTSDAELKKQFPTTGGSEKFIAFIEQELQPFIKANYKINNTQFIIGQSLGGLLATEIALKKPELFSHYIIISPSLWWDNQSLLNESKTHINKRYKNPIQFYISVGSEGKVMINDAKKIADNFKSNKSLMVDFVFLPKENHASILHQSVNECFKLLFPLKK